MNESILRLHADELGRRLPATPAVAEHLSGMSNGEDIPEWLRRESVLAWSAVSRERREEAWLRLCASDATRLPRGLAEVDADLTESLSIPELVDRVLESPDLGMTMYHTPPVGVWVYLSGWDYYFHSPRWDVIPCSRVAAADVRCGTFIRMLPDGACEVGVIGERGRVE